MKVLWAAGGAMLPRQDPRCGDRHLANLGLALRSDEEQSEAHAGEGIDTAAESQ